MKTGTLLTIVIFCFLLSPILSAGQNAKKYFKTGEEFVKQQNFTDAIAQYTKALELDPKMTKAYLARAKTYEKIDDEEDALQDYNRARVFLPKDASVHYNVGRLLNKLEKYEEALKMLDLTTKISKKYLRAYQEKVTSLLALNQSERALKVADSALTLKKNALNYYNRGLVNNQQEEYEKAKKDFSSAIGLSPNMIDAYLERASTNLKLNLQDAALNDCNRILNKDKQNTRAYLIRSKIYVKRLEYPSAINDISRIILIDPKDYEMYILRGTYYQEFNQHANAITDFTKAISLNVKNPQPYFLRAKSYEEMLDFKNAAKDYKTIGTFSKYDGRAMKLKDEAEKRLFEINRESVKPIIALKEPKASAQGDITVPLNKEELLIKGEIEEQSDLDLLQVNGKEVKFEKSGEHYIFLASVNLEDQTQMTIKAIDVYQNVGEQTYLITRTEVNKPQVEIIAPYASDNGEIYLSSADPNLFVEGKIQDESLIRSIMVEGMNASFRPDEKNPTFSATINILNKNKFTVEATDIYGNVSKQDFAFNREGVITQENPMGKTWVVFINNSNYQTFASLEGPIKDISMMKGALANYQINNIIVKRDMTKTQLEKFFSIDLRDLVRSNQVNSIMIWYAGHGKFINETGYWIPVDAKRDDEFTYFNINSLRASLESYSKFVTHTLVVSDACESGPTFYQAMRGATEERNCDDWKATRFKSSQVFSSAGYELAVDNSQFTKTFANALANNPNACIPIENIVTKVTAAVAKNNQQRPQFGKIAGLEDENGTFFFIAK